MELAEAFVKIRPDSKSFDADVRREVEEPLARVKRLAAGLAVGAAALSFAKGGLDELKEQQAVAAKLEATLRATGGAANVTKDELDDMASSLQDLTGEDAEAIQSGQALLLQFTKVRNEVGEGNAIFDRATQTAMDLAAVDALVFAAYVGVCATAATGRPDDVPDFSAALRAIVAAVHDHAARPC